MCERSGEWDRVLECYTSDPQRQMQAFVFIQKVFIESDLDANASLQSTTRKGMVERSVVSITKFSFVHVIKMSIVYVVQIKNKSLA